MSRWNTYYRFYKIAPVYLSSRNIRFGIHFLHSPLSVQLETHVCYFYRWPYTRCDTCIGCLSYLFPANNPMLLPTLLLSLPSSRESRKIISLCWPVTSEVCKAEAVLYTVQYSAIEGDFADILDSTIWKILKYVLLISWLKYALLLQIEPRCNYNYNWVDV